MKPLKSWQKSCENTFTRYVDPKSLEIFDEEFREHIEYLRNNIDDIDGKLHDYGDFYTSALDIFIAHFGFDANTKGFLREFILNSRVDYELVKSGFVIINADDTSNHIHGTHKEPLYDIDPTDISLFGSQHIEGRHMSLVIPAGATITDLRKFIAENKAYIDERLTEIRPKRSKRRTAKPSAKRNARIKELTRQGKRPQEIANIINDEFPGAYSPSDIYTFKYRNKTSRKSDRIS